MYSHVCIIFVVSAWNLLGEVQSCPYKPCIQIDPSFGDRCVNYWRTCKLLDDECKY